MSTWTWQYEDADGAILDAPRSEVFTSRADAESWIGENWPSVAELGVHRVRLLNAATPIGTPIVLT
jgi:hypothetical protein